VPNSVVTANSDLRIRLPSLTMNEPYQDPDPVSSIKTQAHIRKASAGESKKLFRSLFARAKHGSNSTAAAVPPNGAATTHSNPVAANDDVTLVNHEVSHDPDAEFDNAPERWNFKLKDRNASAPASDVGEYARATSVDDRASFDDLMEKTRGMTPEQVAGFLRTRDRVDGEKIMNGRKGSGYQMLAGPFSGTM
jgi:hypothetical protein